MYTLHNIKFISLLLKIVIFLFLSGFQSLHAQQFTPTSFRGIKITPDNISSCISEEENSYKKLKETDDNSADVINALIKLSQLERIIKDYSAAYNYAGEALFLAENLNNAMLLSHAHQECGLLNYLFKQDNAMGKNMRQSLHYAKQAYNEGSISHAQLYAPYYHCLLYNQRIENLNQMALYIDTCQIFIDQYGWGIEKTIYINEKNAFYKYRKNKEDEAIELLKKAEYALEHRKDLNHHQSYLIVVQGVLGDDLRLQGRMTEANEYFEKSLSHNDDFGEHTFYLEYLHTIYAELLFRDKDSKKAYRLLKKAQHINYNFLNPRKNAAQGFFSIRDRYREELDLRNRNLQLQAVKIAEQKAQLWEARIIFFCIAFTLIISLLLILRKRQKQQQEREIISYQERRRYNEALIDSNNKELTSNMLQLIEKEEIIKTLSDTLKEEVPGSKTKSLLKSIEQQSSNLWDDFNKRFMAQNSDFYEHLKEKAPNLSSADLKICALIKLNFSGKEMAHLLGISEGSVHVARHRLRKKMGLGRDINLTQYINAI